MTEAELLLTGWVFLASLGVMIMVFGYALLAQRVARLEAKTRKPRAPKAPVS